VIQRAHDGAQVLPHDVGVNLRRLDVGVAHELLHDPDVHPVFKEMGGEAVAEGVAGHVPVDSRPVHGDLHGFLQAGLQHVVAPLNA